VKIGRPTADRRDNTLRVNQRGDIGVRLSVGDAAIV